MEIGKVLQEERLNQGLSLEEVKNETKIQARYLAAIEENDWSKMPGNFYVRAFIREYAEALGMDPAPLLEEHKSELPQTDDVSYEYVSTPSRARRGSRSGNSPFFSFLPKLLVFLLVIGIIFGIWYSYVNYIHPALTEDDGSTENEEGLVIAPDNEEESSGENGDSAEEGSEEDANGSEGSDESDNEEEQSEEETEQPSLSVEEVDEDAATPLTTVRLNDAESLELEFEIDGETYLWVRGLEDGQRYGEERVYTSEDSPLTIDASESDQVELNIGNASAVDLTISGAEFEYQIDKNDEVHQKVHILWEPSDS